MHHVLLTAFNQYQQELLAFIKKRLSDASLANDLLHELYIKLELYPHDRVVNSPRAYLYRAANNLVADFFRQQARSERKTSASDSDDIVDQRTPEHILEQRQRLRLLQDAVNELPEKCQQVFRWHKFEHMTKTDIAAKLGISTNMVEKYLRRALLHCHDRILMAEKQ